MVLLGTFNGLDPKPQAGTQVGSHSQPYDLVSVAQGPLAPAFVHDGSPESHPKKGPLPDPFKFY
jgi:hypothetical protein